MAELVTSPNYRILADESFQGLTNGTAILGFITDRFRLRDVIGRSVIIHENQMIIELSPQVILVEGLPVV